MYCVIWLNAFQRAAIRSMRCFDKASYDRGELTSRDTTKRDKTRDLHFNTLDFDAPPVGGFIHA